jgi:hypothetical protein
MRYMLFQSTGIEENIIEIDKTEDIKKLAETIVGVGLERSGSISEAKGHKEVFEVSILS